MFLYRLGKKTFFSGSICSERYSKRNFMNHPKKQVVSKTAHQVLTETHLWLVLPHTSRMYHVSTSCRPIEPRKKNSDNYFPWNPGCLVGILIIYNSLWKSPYNWVVQLYTLNNQVWWFVYYNPPTTGQHNSLYHLLNQRVFHCSKPTKTLDMRMPSCYRSLQKDRLEKGCDSCFLGRSKNIGAKNRESRTLDGCNMMYPKMEESLTGCNPYYQPTQIMIKLWV